MKNASDFLKINSKKKRAWNRLGFDGGRDLEGLTAEGGDQLVTGRRAEPAADRQDIPVVQGEFVGPHGRDNLGGYGITPVNADKIVGKLVEDF